MGILTIKYPSFEFCCDFGEFLIVTKDGYGYVDDKVMEMNMNVCPACGKDLFIDMRYLGAPLNEDREYYCTCGKRYKGKPLGKLKEIKNEEETKEKN